MKIEVADLELKHFNIDCLRVIQGDLKILTEENYLKLKKQILDKKFKIPFFVWNNLNDNSLNIIDGTQRSVTLKRMRDEEGYEIPDLPCVLIPASSYQDAKETLLAITSSYGKITKEGLLEFIEDIDISVEEVIDDFDLGIDDFEVLEPEDYGDKNNEIDTDNLGNDLEHTCPKCGFEFND